MAIITKFKKLSFWRRGSSQHLMDQILLTADLNEMSGVLRMICEMSDIATQFGSSNPRKKDSRVTAAITEMEGATDCQKKVLAMLAEAARYPRPDAVLELDFHNLFGALTMFELPAKMADILALDDTLSLNEFSIPSGPVSHARSRLAIGALTMLSRLGEKHRAFGPDQLLIAAVNAVDGVPCDFYLDPINREEAIANIIQIVPSIVRRNSKARRLPYDNLRELVAADIPEYFDGIWKDRKLARKYEEEARRSNSWFDRHSFTARIVALLHQTFHSDRSELLEQIELEIFGKHDRAGLNQLLVKELRMTDRHWGLLRVAAGETDFGKHICAAFRESALQGADRSKAMKWLRSLMRLKPREIAMLTILLEGSKHGQAYELIKSDRDTAALFDRKFLPALQGYGFVERVSKLRSMDRFLTQLRKASSIDVDLGGEIRAIDLCSSLDSDEVTEITKHVNPIAAGQIIFNIHDFMDQLSSKARAIMIARREPVEEKVSLFSCAEIKPVTQSVTVLLDAFKPKIDNDAEIFFPPIAARARDMNMMAQAHAC